MESQVHTGHSGGGAAGAPDVTAEPPALVSPGGHIALCIPTLLRNEQLRACLESVSRLELPPGCTLEVIVADNDAGGAAAAVCAEFAARAAPPPRHVIEPRRGLSRVRNRLLEEALRTPAAFIAFLDDDERPAPDWLVRHLEALAGGADVSAGPVLRDAPGPTAPDPSPRIPVRAPRFVACNNVVFRRRLADAQGLRFDPRFDFTGGEDFDYFEASRRLGNRHVWTASARVHEPPVPGRDTLRYLFLRHLSGAMTRVMQERKWRPGAGVWPRYLAKAAGKLAGSGVCLLRAALPPHAAPLREAVKRLAAACGCLCGLLHIRMERYK
jgi:succinoglycan biosynthesis protein ExoM